MNDTINDFKSNLHCEIRINLTISIQHNTFRDIYLVKQNAENDETTKKLLFLSFY